MATNGDDANNGTIDSPFKTFSKAISVMSAGDVCIIRGGIYEEKLLVNKSGTAGNYLTFKSASGENVEIRATTVVDGWQLHTGNIYKANVNMAITSRYRAVYHNDEYMDLARWPNNTDNNRWTLNSIPVTGGDGSHFLVSGIPSIDWTGGLVYYLGAHSGTSWNRTITSSTTSRIDHTGVNVNSWPFNPHNPTVWRNYSGNNRGQLYLFNKLEALDYAREWFYDSTSQTLYFQSATGSMPLDGEVEFATEKYAAELNGNYIQVEDIKFFGGSVLVKGTNNIFLNNTITHGTALHDDLTNTTANIGNAALEVRGANTWVKGCNINHSSANGITVEKWSGAHNSTIEGNYVSNIDYLGIHTTPIRSLADNVKILKNTIVNAGRDGIYVSGDNCEVAYNDVSFSELINSDSGVFYTVGGATLKNTEIHHNWFHDATAPSYSHEVDGPGKAAGIYLDNNSKGYTVHHNVVWNVSWSGYQVNWNNTDLDFFHNTIWNAERAMDSWVNGFAQQNNKVYNNFANTGSWFAGNGPAEFDIQDNLISTVSPFEDVNNQYFMPKPGSVVIDQAMVISGFVKPYEGSAPDIGAYERGGTEWTAGVNAIEDTGMPLSVSEFDEETSLKMYPNPTSTFLNIGFAGNQGFDKTSIAIYSLMGNLLKSISVDGLKGSSSISVQDLSTGVYLVKLKSQHGVYTGKFIKK
ncbi:carbohydrate-binding protein [Algibacter agarivorans]|uniref:Carbohydrate-binding protein n=1 Tax=Algibacter agarivorans TaxID=1109741 RepID=A0ABP9GAN7_9FLAO